MVNPANGCPVSLGQISCKKSITVFANQQSVTLTDATSLQSQEQEFWPNGLLELQFIGILYDPKAEHTWHYLMLALFYIILANISEIRARHRKALITALWNPDFSLDQHTPQIVPKVFWIYLFFLYQNILGSSLYLTSVYINALPVSIPSTILLADVSIYTD